MATKTVAKVSKKSPATASIEEAKVLIPASRARSKPSIALQSAGSHAAGDTVDAQLERYRSMRDFKITAEPSGGDSKRRPRPTGALPFVIQKHAASHLHYDFRLGWNGVLKSWAVAKGPSYNVKDRRLAVQVEDHPMEYGGFEGIIPQGQYGGGTVMVWDEGSWTPQLGYENVEAGLRDGSLKFVMNGSKMRGKWTLVRMGGKAANERKPNWLLIKEHDEFERASDAPCITEEKPNSAVTGRKLDEIGQQQDHVWSSKETAKPGQAWMRQARQDTSARAKERVAAAAPSGSKKKARTWPQLEELPKEAQPTFFPPQLASEGETPPDGKEWLHELKLDGYRIQARKNGASVQMLTRKGLDWTHRMREVAREIAALPVEQLTLDGELVVLQPDGTTSFAHLQASFQNDEAHPLTYFAFDLLHANGHNTRELPLRERKALLEPMLDGAGESVRFSEHLETDGRAMFESACKMHAEGIISKRADRSYRSGRSTDWRKSKCLHEQEFVISGFVMASDDPTHIGSLILSYYKEGQLIYAGRTGTGFTNKMRASLLKQLKPLRTDTTTLQKLTPDAKRGAIWVRSQLVAQVRFATWTADDVVRQAAFLGLREDKAAAEVGREQGASPSPKRFAREHSAGTLEAPYSSARPTKSINKAASAEPPIRLTHPEKVIDAETQLTKRELAAYYWAVAPRMLPHVANRVLSLVRCPDGAGKQCFYQKHVTHMLPPGIAAVDVPDKKTGKVEEYIALHTPEALAGLAQMGVLEVHPWGSRGDDLERPDRITIDLDPYEAISWSALSGAAAEVRARLRAKGLKSFLKTTGGKGLHIVIPIVAEQTWTQVKDFAYRFVLEMERKTPSLYLTKMTKAARKGKIYLDYLRNERGATAVAPYSPRARAGLGVSLPLPWADLGLASPPVFRVKTFNEWRDRLKTDPWKEMMTLKQHLPEPTHA